jgi:flagellar motor switch protein FliG
MNGIDKVAILLTTVGEEAASHVMKHLDAREIRRIGSRMAALSNITAEERQNVYKEFTKLSGEGDVNVEGKEYLQSVLAKALGETKAKEMMKSLAAKNDDNIELLKWINPRSIGAYMKGEHPQTIAAFLVNMEPEQASEVLALLPDQLQGDVMYRMATMEDLSTDALQELGAVLREELKTAGSKSARQLGGPQSVADIVNLMDKTSEATVMATIGDYNGELVDRIQDLMFVFDDLIEMDDRSLQELLKEVSKDDLTLALRSAPEELKELFFRNMSSRAAVMFREDMEAQGPAKVSEIEKAQRDILKVVRRLEEEGRVSVGSKGGGEELV